jgi:hypothetical protein
MNSNNDSSVRRGSRACAYPVSLLVPCWPLIFQVQPDVREEVAGSESRSFFYDFYVWFQVLTSSFHVDSICCMRFILLSSRRFCIEKHVLPVMAQRSQRMGQITGTSSSWTQHATSSWVVARIKSSSGRNLQPMSRNLMRPVDRECNRKLTWVRRHYVRKQTYCKNYIRNQSSARYIARETWICITSQKWWNSTDSCQSFNLWTGDSSVHWRTCKSATKFCWQWNTVSETLTATFKTIGGSWKNAQTAGSGFW